MAHEMIHGGGSDSNTGNRWFDKTMQVIRILYYSYSALLETQIVAMMIPIQDLSDDFLLFSCFVR